MNWKVFNRDDHNTHPKLDCKFLVCGDNDELKVCEWDNSLKCFYDGNGFVEYWECLYVTISYLPFIEKELHPAKCKEDRYLCSHYDDGYCLGEDTKCKSIEEVTEYVLGSKPIWKEFE